MIEVQVDRSVYDSTRLGQNRAEPLSLAASPHHDYDE